MSYHADPTANQAIGNFSREWKKLAGIALEIRSGKRKMTAELRSRYAGIYGRLLRFSDEILLEIVRPSSESGGAVH